MKPIQITPRELLEQVREIAYNLYKLPKEVRAEQLALLREKNRLVYVLTKKALKEQHFRMQR